MNGWCHRIILAIIATKCRFFLRISLILERDDILYELKDVRGAKVSVVQNNPSASTRPDKVCALL